MFAHQAMLLSSKVAPKEDLLREGLAEYLIDGITTAAKRGKTAHSFSTRGQPILHTDIMGVKAFLENKGYSVKITESAYSDFCGIPENYIRVSWKPTILDRIKSWLK